jgi:hypothetical protein
MAVTPPKKGRGWDLANTNIQEWIKLFQGVGVMKVYISMLKKKIWASFQRIIELFTQKIVTKL